MPNSEDTAPNETVMNEKMRFGTLELTEELMKDAKKAVLDRFNAVKSDREERFRKYADWQRLYEAKSKTSDKDTLAEIMTTDGFNSVEDWVALMMDAMFPVDPPFDLKGKKREISEEQLSQIKKVLADDMRATDYEGEFEDVSRQGPLLGTLSSKMFWDISDEPALFVENKPMTQAVESTLPDGTPVSGEMPLRDENGQVMTMPVMTEKIEIEDRPRYKFVPLDKLYFRSDKLKWMIELSDSTWSEIENEAGLYGNLEKAKKTVHPNNPTPLDKEGKPETNDKSLYSVDGELELMESHHIPVPILDPSTGKKKRVLCIVVLANREEVIRVQPTPYRDLPYKLTQFFKKRGVEGMGLIEIMEKMLREINTRRTQALDANTYGLYGMKVVNMRYIKKPDQLKIRKDGLVELKETDKPIDQIIQFFRPPVEYASASFALIDRITMDMVRTTRMKGVLAGEKVQPQPSATEWAGMMKEALKSIKVILKRVAREQIEEFLDKAYTMNVLNRQKPWIVPIEIKVPPSAENPAGVAQVKTEWTEVTPEQIYTDGLDIRAVGTAYMEDEIAARHQQMQELDLLMKVAQLPMFNDAGQAVMPDFYRQTRRIVAAFGDREPDAAFRLVPPQPVMPMGNGPEIAAPGAPGTQNVPINAAEILKSALGGTQ